MEGSRSRVERIPEEVASEIGKILNWLGNNSEANMEKLKQYLRSFETPDEILVFFKKVKKQLKDGILEERLLTQCNEVLREKFRKKILPYSWHEEKNVTLAFA